MFKQLTHVGGRKIIVNLNKVIHVQENEGGSCYIKTVDDGFSVKESYNKMAEILQCVEGEVLC